MLALLLVAALAAPAHADSVLTPVGTREEIGKVTQVAASADGQTVAIAAMGEARARLWLADAAGGSRRLLAQSDDSQFDITASGRHLLLGERRFDLQTGSSVQAGGRYGETLAEDGSVFTAQEHVARRIGPDGRTSTVRSTPARLPSAQWGLPEHGAAGGRGLGWCGPRVPARLGRPAGPLYLGLLDSRANRLKMVSSRVRATNGYSECLTSRNGTAVATIASLKTARPGRNRNVLLARSAGSRVRHYTLSKSPIGMFLSPDGRFALAGDADINRGACAASDSIGGLLVFDLVANQRRLVRFRGPAFRDGSRSCLRAPTWDAAGRRVAFELGASTLVLDPATGRTSMVSTAGVAVSPLAFTPDGSRLLLSSGDAWYSVSTAEPGEQPLRLTDASFMPGSAGPWFSRDLVFLRDDDGALFSTPLAAFGTQPLVRAG